MDVRSWSRRALRFPGLTPGQVIFLYVAALLCLTAALVLLPYSRAIDVLVVAWCYLFLIFAVGVLTCLMTAFGCVAWLWVRQGIRDLATRPKGVSLGPAPSVRLDPLWDRWTDG